MSDTKPGFTPVVVTPNAQRAKWAQGLEPIDDYPVPAPDPYTGPEIREIVKNAARLVEQDADKLQRSCAALARLCAAKDLTVDEAVRVRAAYETVKLAIGLTR